MVRVARLLAARCAAVVLVSSAAAILDPAATPPLAWRSWNAFLVEKKWGEVDFPTPFGREEYPEEAFIRKLDEKTGASLKLTVINPKGRVWTMVAGGGASVVYADTVVDYGFGHELANYGEYSGAPTAEETFQYAQTLFQLMFKSKPHPEGKVFITCTEAWPERISCVLAVG